MTLEKVSYLHNRISVDPDVCNGKPTIRGKRITVHTVLDYLSVGESVSEILRQHPSLEAEDIPACLAFASRMMDQRYTLQKIA